MIGDGDCGEIGGMKIGRGNRSVALTTRRAEGWDILKYTSNYEKGAFT
jgi:hypothetical protein